jgi:hypothetical protein
MNYLGENDQPVSSLTDDCFTQRIFIFSLKEEDYFLNYFMGWEKVQTQMYVVKVDKYSFKIPSGMYIYTGCPSGNTDWILVDEIVGRQSIELFLMPPSFKSWELHPMKLVDVYNGEMNSPNTKNVIPIIDDLGERCLLVASKDIYHQWKHKDFSTPFVV